MTFTKNMMTIMAMTFMISPVQVDAGFGLPDNVEFVTNMYNSSNCSNTSSYRNITLNHFCYDTKIVEGYPTCCNDLLSEISLFENADGIITCLKMAARTDEYTQKLIKTHTQLIGTLSGHNPIKSVLIEQKRREKKLHPHFAEFWTYYPKKKDKQQALKAWNKQKPDMVAVKKALIQQKRSEEWTKDGGQFVPYPSTYINRRRWEDEEPVKAIVQMRAEN